MSLRMTLLGVLLLFVGTSMAMEPQQPVPAEAPIQYSQAELGRADKDFEQFKSNAKTIVELRQEHLAAWSQAKTEQKESLKQRINALEEENRNIIAKLESYTYNNPLMSLTLNMLKALMQ